MNDHILQAIDEELAKLREARAILASATAQPRRTLSPKARRAIAEAQRKRWAKAKSVPQTAASGKV